MPKHYRNCLYVHGLHSNVNSDKTAILEKYTGEVTAFHLDYGHRHDSFVFLETACRERGVDLIVGSSFGGYLGFYLSKRLQVPCILFNPALFFREQDRVFVPGDEGGISPFALMVIGQKDNVIPPGSIDRFVEAHPEETGIRRMHCDWLPHRIDLTTFEASVAAGIRLLTGLNEKTKTGSSGMPGKTS